MLLLLLLACADAPGDTAGDCADRPDVTWNNWTDGFFMTYCRACHSGTTPDRSGAPEGVDFDTAAQVAEWSARIRARTVEDQDMPPAGGVYEDELELLDTYLDCAL